MARVRQKQTKNQRPGVRPAMPNPVPETLTLDDGTVKTPATVAMIRALIPLRLKAVEDAFGLLPKAESVGVLG